jgi:hypothetical protein
MLQFAIGWAAAWFVAALCVRNAWREILRQLGGGE